MPIGANLISVSTLRQLAAVVTAATFGAKVEASDIPAINDAASKAYNSQRLGSTQAERLAAAKAAADAKVALVRKDKPVGPTKVPEQVPPHVAHVVPAIPVPAPVVHPAPPNGPHVIPEPEHQHNPGDIGTK